MATSKSQYYYIFTIPYFIVFSIIRYSLETKHSNLLIKTDILYYNKSTQKITKKKCLKL